MIGFRALTRLCLAISLATGVLGGMALAQSPVSTPPAKAPRALPDPDSRVHLLLDLLADPQIRDWLEKQRAEGKARPAEDRPAEASPFQVVAAQLDAIRKRLVELARAAPGVPAELARAWMILDLEIEERGWGEIMGLVSLFAALGFGAERLFWWATRHVRPRIIAAPLDTVAGRGRAVLMRLAFGLSWIAAFGVGSIGAFLPFRWPPLIREIVLSVLVAFLLTRLAIVVGRFLLAPGAERFRIVPLTTLAARHWHRRLTLVVGVMTFAFAAVSLLTTLGVSSEGVRLFAAVFGLALLAIGGETMIRRPPPPADATAEHHARGGVTVLAIAFFAVLWLLRLTSQMPLFWTLVALAGVPFAIGLTRRSVNHLLRPVGGAETPELLAGIYNICLERGLRALWIAAGALIVAGAWGVDLLDVGDGESLGRRLIRGGINVVVIVLVADFAWNLIKAVIDGKLVQRGAAADGDRLDDEEARHNARVRTLLPILKNMTFIVFIVIVTLMAMASLGIEIGPLIAGAGVIGVAVGFGAQTLVRDIISGIFYLLDDAFRIGEYIQSGTYKGTVESFSLRSVKLRHHRGPLYTIPFGTLGAVQNMSRDWVIDKTTIGVTYDSDLALAKKLIKQIGKDLTEIPEFEPNIIETIKMQGVDNFGDFAVNIRLKMMTRPGEQFVIRRHAFGMIKKAFDANGIKFAVPQVQVAGGGDDDAIAGAARHAMEVSRAATKANAAPA